MYAKQGLHTSARNQTNVVFFNNVSGYIIGNCKAKNVLTAPCEKA